MKFDPEKHHRRSVRLQGYDYAQAGAYFVTICAAQRECVLGQVKAGVAVLSQYGHIVERCWQTLPRSFPQVELDAFVIMPNHMHGIIILTGCHTEGRGEAFAYANNPPSHNRKANASPLRLAHGTQPGSLEAIMQNFKSVSTRKINRIRVTPGLPLWQRNYYEHIIRDDTELYAFHEYIMNNPLQWELDQENPLSQKEK